MRSNRRPARQGLLPQLDWLSLGYQPGEIRGGSRRVDRTRGGSGTMGNMSAPGNLCAHQFRARVLDGMDPDERALSLAQESVRFDHPNLDMRLPETHTEASETLRYWLHGAGHPRADEAHVTMHRDPSRTSSNTGRGPDGESAVGLHPQRCVYGTLTHETAHRIPDQEIGR